MDLFDDIWTRNGEEVVIPFERPYYEQRVVEFGNLLPPACRTESSSPYRHRGSIDGVATVRVTLQI